MLLVEFLRWFFSNSGIQYTMQRPHRLVIFGKQLVYLNPFPGIEYRPDGPSTVDYAKWLQWGKILKLHKCGICGTAVWAYKKVKVCGSFSCFRKNGGKWK